jgi:hypothetical protein
VKRTSGDAQADAQYEVTFSGSKELGRISSNIRIEIEGSEVPSINVPIRANVVGNLRYSKNLYFLKRDGEFKERDIVLTTRSGEPVKIKKVEDPDGKLKTTVVEAEGQRVKVTASVADPKVAYERPSRHVLYIYTTDKDEPKVEINYTISERRGTPRRAKTRAGLLKPPLVDKKKPKKRGGEK